MIRKHWLAILLVLALVWIFHVHYNRGIPVKRNTARK